MAMMAATDALAALHASLANEREWRNIQKTVATTASRVAIVLNAQMQQMERMVSRMELLEAKRDQHIRDSDANMAHLQSEMASTIKEFTARNSEKLMERVCAHVDAQMAAQVSKIESQLETFSADMNQQAKTNEQLHADTAARMQRDRNEQHKTTAMPPPPPPPLEATVDRPELEALTRRQKRIDKQMRTMESDFLSRWTAWRQELTETLASKVSHREMETFVDTKTESETVDVKRIEAIVRDLHEATGTRAIENTTAKGKDRPAVQTQIQTQLQELLSIVEIIQDEQTTLKEHITCPTHEAWKQQQGDTKRAISKLHEVVKSVNHRLVETVAKKSELESLNEQVAWIRKQLRSEMYQARYIWKDGRPNGKQLVPWTTQAVNTNSDVFVWQPHTKPECIMTMVPGLYHLQAAFFTRFAPTLQVFVNGEPALLLLHSDDDSGADTHDPAAEKHAAVATANNLQHTIRRRRLHHSGGNLVGVEICAFLALPARASVSIGYDISERAQGFLNLRKL